MGNGCGDVGGGAADQTERAAAGRAAAGAGLVGEVTPTGGAGPAAGAALAVGAGSTGKTASATKTAPVGETPLTGVVSTAASPAAIGGAALFLEGLSADETSAAGRLADAGSPVGSDPATPAAPTSGKTGGEVFRLAMSLLGYTGPDGAVDGAQSAELFRRGLDIVNQVLADLWPLERRDPFQPLVSLQQEIPLSAAAATDVMPYGAALFLAQTDGDGSNQAFFANLYESKRNRVRRPSARREDRLPHPDA